MDKTHYEELSEELFKFESQLTTLFSESHLDADVSTRQIKRLDTLKKMLQPLGVEVIVLDFGSHFCGKEQARFIPSLLFKTEVATIDIKKGKFFNTLRIYDDEQDYFWLLPQKKTVHFMSEQKMKHLSDVVKNINLTLTQTHPKYNFIL